jgi:hypothetical protein
VKLRAEKKTTRTEQMLLVNLPEVLTRNSSRIKYFALVTASSSPGSAVAEKKKK